MLTQLNAENFKSWQNIGEMGLASVTGLFGTNSSGKTSILQLILMLKQTIESANRKQIIDFGSEDSYVNLGNYRDIIYNHEGMRNLNIALTWELAEPIEVYNYEISSERLFKVNKLTFQLTIALNLSLIVQEFNYSFFDDQGKTYKFGMKRQGADEYQLVAEGYPMKAITEDQDIFLPNPIKNYGFPSQTYTYYPQSIFLSEFVLELEKLFQNIYYLGPLREYPRRSYLWTGNQPQDVGKRGEYAVSALLANRLIDNHGQRLEDKVAYWLRELKIIEDFSLIERGDNNQAYKLLVKHAIDGPEVLITDVGFGVSQILPVLVLCYYVPEGSTILLEQPEIHLHPSVQAGLADVFIDAVKTRNVQIILESHSEHLLRRLQRRIAEEKQKFSERDTALYFCQTTADGTSELLPLELDTFGNINNWPEGFFGDEMGDLVAMTEAGLKRQMEV